MGPGTFFAGRRRSAAVSESAAAVPGRLPLTPRGGSIRVRRLAWAAGSRTAALEVYCAASYGDHGRERREHGRGESPAQGRLKAWPMSVRPQWLRRTAPEGIRPPMNRIQSLSTALGEISFS